MMTLNDLFEVCWNITRAEITARDKNLQFIHKWIFGQSIDVSMYMRHDVENGKLTIVDTKLNAHGDTNRSGYTEIGWGVKEKVIPKELRESPVIVLQFSNGMRHEEDCIYADVELHPMSAEVLMRRYEKKDM